MSECSVFVDESGDTGSDSDFYRVTLVFHNQGDSILGNIARYEQRLRDAGLPDVPFHMEPLLAGEGDYKRLSLETRAKLLNYFHEFAVRCPICYRSFLYDKNELGRRGSSSKEISEKLGSRMGDDLSAFLRDNLSHFQAYDVVRVYYDNGQAELSKALQRAFSAQLSKSAFERKDRVDYHRYRLAQIADMVCGFEHLDSKFSNGTQTKTDLRFVDDHKNLRKRFLKKLHRLKF